MNQQGMIDTVKQYILREFLPGEDPAALTESTSLILGGIIDSIKTIKLVSFLEETYGVQFEAHEITADHLDTLSDIAATIASKKAAT